MHSLLQGRPARELAVRELPAVAGSIAIAEAFYRFHSFTLECLAFLATWWALSRLAHAVLPAKDVTARLPGAP